MGHTVTKKEVVGVFVRFRAPLHQSMNIARLAQSKGVHSD
jgi:hypothetical protein